MVRDGDRDAHHRRCLLPAICRRISKKDKAMEKKQQFNLSYVVTAILGVLILQNLLMAQFRPRLVPYSEFVRAVGDDRVSEISIGETAIHGRMRDERKSSSKPFAWTAIWRPSSPNTP